MAVYAIGDIQGCYDELQALLDRLQFDPAVDRLWLVGDLVNRGPKSVEVLRFVKELGDAAVTVLGNHDLHLLAVAYGHGKEKQGEALQGVLNAPDRDELIEWLRTRPLLHRDKALGFTMVHAGLPPQWDIKKAQACAREVEEYLAGPDYLSYFEHMYGNKPALWDPRLKGMDRLRFITNCFTRLRFCSYKGRLELKEKGRPGKRRDGLIPWFVHPKRRSAKERIIFGHWSTLGYLAEDNVWALDTGCLWGGMLTALRIDLKSPEPMHFSCPGRQSPMNFA